MGIITRIPRELLSIGAGAGKDVQKGYFDPMGWVGHTDPDPGRCHRSSRAGDDALFQIGMDGLELPHGHPPWQAPPVRYRKLMLDHAGFQRAEGILRVHTFRS